MKKSNNYKKGFTLVELVIVIAVIAILAGVLIPTFSSIIEKANASNDISLVRNINNVLEVSESLDKQPNDKKEVKKVLSDYGINETKNKAKNHIIFWSKSNNMFFIWGIKEQKIIFPEYCKNKTLEDFDDEINMSFNEVKNMLEVTGTKNFNYPDVYMDDARIVSGGSYKKGNDSEGFVATRAIAIDTSKYDSLTIYISGGNYDNDSFCAIHLIINDEDLREVNGGKIFENQLNNIDFQLDFELIKISNEYYKFVCNDYESLKSQLDKDTIYFATSLKGLGENLIITINEEIYD